MVNRLYTRKKKKKNLFLIVKESTKFLLYSYNTHGHTMTAVHRLKHYLSFSVGSASDRDEISARLTGRD